MANLGIASEPPSYGIRAVDRVLDVLDALRAAAQNPTLAELARAAKLPKSSAFRYLATLEARGYVVRSNDGERYRLGVAHSPPRPGDLVRLAAVARPHMEALCERFEETINLGVLDRTRIAYLDIIESPRALRFVAHRGSRDPIHSSALGKAIAASLNEPEVRQILAAEGMPVRTARTIDNLDRYLRELTTVRARGYAIDNGENEESGFCVGVALSGCRVPSALSISAPIVRFADGAVEQAVTALRGAARLIAAEFRHGDHA